MPGYRLIGSRGNAFSGIAYTGAKGLDLDWCAAPDAGLPAPDLVLYLEVPVEVAEQRGEYGEERYEKREFQAKVRNRSMLYGPASAIHLQMDRALMSCVQRMPCLPSEHVGLEIVMGKDETLDFVDFLGDPALDMSAVKMTVHEINEAAGL